MCGGSDAADKLVLSVTGDRPDLINFSLDTFSIFSGVWRSSWLAVDPLY
jgi:hypothetical protein